MRAIVPLLTLPVLALALQFVGPPVTGHAQEDARSTISVVGEGRILVDPDIANLSLGVESTAPTLSEAQADAARRMQAVIDALLAQGVAREDIRTGRLSISPIYDNRDGGQIRGYRAANLVQVKIRDLNRIGTIVDTVTAAGANRVEGISFAVENLAPPKDRARAEALANARAKAEQLASLAGVRIVGVKSIVEADPAARPVPIAREAAMPMGAAAAAPTPVEPGTQEVQTQVSVTYVVW